MDRLLHVVLYIGLADGRKVDGGPEYVRGSRVIDEMRDVGQQVPGLKQVLQKRRNLCEIDINPMGASQRKRKQPEARTQVASHHHNCTIPIMLPALVFTQSSPK